MIDTKFVALQDVAKTLRVQNVEYLLDVLAWACDGQFTEMQTILRSQEAQFSVSFMVVSYKGHVLAKNAARSNYSGK